MTNTTTIAASLSEAQEIVRATAMSLPPSDFGSGRAINAMAAVLEEQVQRAFELGYKAAGGAVCDIGFTLAARRHLLKEGESEGSDHGG